MDTLLFMLPPLLASLIYVGLQSYVGLHILARGVIFVDLALAQLATVGIALAMVFGFEPVSLEASLAGFAFTVLGAALFAWMRRIEERTVPHEALIGITYVVGSAAMILVLAGSPHGSENIKSLLVGAILWITWEDIGWMALIYGVLAALHWWWRDRFIAVSYDRARDRSRDMLWDFLFYLIFGIIVTSSVRLAGVLLVFSFLIIPAVMSAFFARDLAARMVIAWVLGAVGAALGIAVSFQADLPTGAAIVCVYGAMLVLTLVYAFRPGAARQGAIRTGRSSRSATTP
jgi:zinc/manganese transport system permease protein